MVPRNTAVMNGTKARKKRFNTPVSGRCFTTYSQNIISKTKNKKNTLSPALNPLTENETPIFETRTCMQEKVKIANSTEKKKLRKRSPPKEILHVPGIQQG